MEQSAIEKELLKLTLNIRDSIRRHDRGVIIGFLMSCVPILPITATGLIVNFFNLYLIKVGKLNIFEIRLIKIALVISIINILAGTLILMMMYKTMNPISPFEIINFLTNTFLSISEFIRGLFFRDSVLYVIGEVL